MFKWLYKGRANLPTGVGNEYDVVPGWFKLIAQFDHDGPACATAGSRGSRRGAPR